MYSETCVFGITFLRFLKCHFRNVKSRFFSIFKKNRKNVFSNYVVEPSKGSGSGTENKSFAEKSGK